jgi:hypothetical protein
MSEGPWTSVTNQLGDMGNSLAVKKRACFPLSVPDITSDR